MENPTHYQLPLIQGFNLSSFIMDTFKQQPLNLQRWDFSPTIKKQELQAFIHLIKHLIYELGDIEHSSDWDPYLTIQYTDDEGNIQTLQTESGYYLMETDNPEYHKDSISIDDYDEDEDEDITRVIPIKDIISIQIHD